MNVGHHEWPVVLFICVWIAFFLVESYVASMWRLETTCPQKDRYGIVDAVHFPCGCFSMWFIAMIKSHCILSTESQIV